MFGCGWPVTAIKIGKAFFVQSVCTKFEAKANTIVRCCFVAETRGGPANVPRSMFQICSYNPLTASTRQGYRLEEILAALLKRIT